MNRMTPRAAFQPPSDMGSGSSGGSSTGKKLFIGFGIGCGALLLIFGLLFAMGAFKAVSCCSDIQQFAGDATAAVTFADEFAQDLHKGNLEQAYGKTTATYQATVDRGTFEDLVETHRHRLNAPPRQAAVNVEHHGDEAPSMDALKNVTWLIDYHFADTGDTTLLWANFRVVPKEEGGFAIDGVLFDERPRNLATEPAPKEVQTVFAELSAGRYEAVHVRLDQGMRDTLSVDQWRTFLGAEGAVLTSGRMEIREVSYSDDGKQATVLTHHTTADGTNAIVQWELRPGVGMLQWRVAAIAPLVGQQAEQQPVEQPVQEDALEQVDGEPSHPSDTAPPAVISVDVE